ncbi:serine/threonine-protein kinase [Pedobacter sp. SYSU D00535]|uniref:serine/threonine protein kinase n=1 Tax=Pedobacter sp. SYSU D00535 TaxID=2810308 RepID=UPI001A968C10|nr:serine/threonine-protein kinase [Pedobacter sp. SYSU D00535]
MSRIFTITEGLENMGALKTGGQGSVYKGKRIGEIITAVKLLPTPIHREDNDDKNFRDFQNEVAKLKKVNELPNPNVVKILSSGITESGGLPFIEMEFIEGPDLEELLKPPHDPVFTVPEVIKVASHLSNALAHCHRVAVKHGDVKSNNVKFNVHTGNYMLLDFGLAIMSDEQRRTSLRQAGAIEFMAPEQNQGEMFFQTDVYSFGVVLFELLAGVVPFPLADNGETSRNNVMVSHLEAPVPDVLELRRKHLPENWSEERKQKEMQVPEWLVQLVNKCLEKKPENRFADGMQLQEAILFNSLQPLTTATRNAEELAVIKKENEHLRALLLQQKRGRREAAPTERSAGGWAGNLAYYKNKFAGLNVGAQVAIGVVLLFLIVSGFSRISGSRADAAFVADTALLNAENRSLRDSLKYLNAQRLEDSVRAAQALAEAREAEAKRVQALYAGNDREKDWEKDREKQRQKRKEKLKKFFEVRFER